ncbi:tripartite tricarboxylate transporter substrate binding protein [Variovorax sp. J2P1-59]|uniref:Bug family tripartite tricarboxylate transporter substrate binding protein n=1 Tax=Variovorax flavidus TaxID=3053501 RepID=UPI002575C361|nr:tripartite tricarboxylate transporter substrate binding protein [Variovorax sp. J2P1-59]MDM0073287.1 tripartite tricarboxylate transporter substrate binding protein [Variovorax sp. J2P1-59]
MNLGRRRWLERAAALALTAGPLAHVPRAVASDAFPTRPIMMWVPWAAGGATDLSLRLLAELAAPALGQPVIVANRPGAGGTLAMPVLQQAEPNGYTIAQMPQPVFRAPFMQKVLWDPVRDVTPIIQISGVTFGVLVRAGSPMRALGQLFDFARARPGELSIATNGVGTTPHLVLEALFTERGLRYIHVPYKGTSELTLAVASGQVMAGVNSSGFAPEVDAGRLRLLATFGAQRSPRWPKVPTLRDLGFDIVAMSPYGLAGPRGLPPDVLAVLHDGFKKALFDPRFGDDLARYDQEVTYLGPEDYAQACREEYAKERAAVERMKVPRSAGG